jgi:GTP cyclohydrolase II
MPRQGEKYLGKTRNKVNNSTNDKAHMKIERACAELRRGGVLMVRLANGEACLLRAAELIRDGDTKTLSRLTGSGAILVLTDNRLASLGKHLRASHKCATIPVSTTPVSVLIDLAIASPDEVAIGDETSLIGERGGSVADVTTRLLRIAKLIPAAILARLPSHDIVFQNRLAQDHNILTVEVRDIEQYGKKAAQQLKIATRAKVPLAVDPDAEVVMFRADGSGEEHFAVLVGGKVPAGAPLVRLHSQCITGDVLGSLKCDCGDQLQAALRYMADHGGGVLVYLAQEGRDIGLLNKMRAYALQDNGLDTVDANHALGFESDERLFLPACRILQELGISAVRLITNNPDKIAQLDKAGITVCERVPLAGVANAHNQRYLNTKRDRSGHLLD